ncbi:hypothetical protein SAMN06265795_10898 [Noviherbaspirillum humi]|uniref:Uncharacterized protein n=1 Tax=Noviherbaspirillum humi TaxID=1688639 RepID=A0A239I3W1_9BURK|nr:hypothetical protein SAMN06265795_10898 [Noviherbaspirillum humi]
MTDSSIPWVISPRCMKDPNLRIAKVGKLFSTIAKAVRYTNSYFCSSSGVSTIQIKFFGKHQPRKFANFSWTNDSIFIVSEANDESHGVGEV